MAVLVCSPLASCFCSFSTTSTCQQYSMLSEPSSFSSLASCYFAKILNIIDFVKHSKCFVAVSKVFCGSILCFWFSTNFTITFKLESGITVTYDARTDRLLAVLVWYYCGTVLVVLRVLYRSRTDNISEKYRSIRVVKLICLNGFCRLAMN